MTAPRLGCALENFTFALRVQKSCTISSCAQAIV
jgi:hypothetical protein